MANAPDSQIVSAPVFQQVSVDALLITPAGGSQTTLANVVNGGTLAQTLAAGSSLTSPVIGGIQSQSVTNGITASTTQTLAGAVPLTSAINVISTVATAANAVKLAPVSVNIGQVQMVMNNGASACAIFPFETATAIDAAGTAASVTLTNGRSANFFQNTASTWVSQGSVGHAT
jgi:hypothetical protein